MTDGSDVSPEVASDGEIWGTLEELLLACAVSRHGTASWDSVATEVQTRSPLAARPRLTPRSCRLRFHHLHRRFSVLGAGAGAEKEEAEGQGHGEVEDPDASAADGWLDELRRLRVAELRREVERCDLSIGTLQSKVELMKEERERSVSGEATKPEGVTGDENVSSEEPGRSCRESNSTDLKRPRGVKEEGEAEKQEASGESMAASKESSASLCRRGGRKASGGAGEEESEEAASLQPLAALLDRVAARFGPVFERLQESQESESYRGTIRRHVDLDTMRRKLDDGGGGYPSSELYRDLLLLCANAAVYLPRHAPEHAAAALNALRLVSAQVSASLREPTQPKRELLVGTLTAAALADSRRAEAGAADIVGPLIEKAVKPLIFCRKRSSIAKSAAAAAVAAAIARKEEAEKAELAKEAQEEESDGEKKKADMAVGANDKAWGMRTKKTRGPGKNSAKALAAKAAAEAAAATESDSNKKGDADGATAAGGLPKKRIAVDFLKRLNQGTSTTKKRGSPLTKRKRSAPAQEEEEQPKARRGPGRKSTGRGGSRGGGKAGTPKRRVGRPPAKRAAPSVTPPPAKRAKVNRSERSSSSSRRGGRKS